MPKVEHKIIDLSELSHEKIAESLSHYDIYKVLLCYEPLFFKSAFQDCLAVYKSYIEQGKLKPFNFESIRYIVDLNTIDRATTKYTCKLMNENMALKWIIGALSLAFLLALLF